MVDKKEGNSYIIKNTSKNGKKWLCGSMAAVQLMSGFTGVDIVKADNYNSEQVFNVMQKISNNYVKNPNFQGDVKSDTINILNDWKITFPVGKQEDDGFWNDNQPRWESPPQRLNYRWEERFKPLPNGFVFHSWMSDERERPSHNAMKQTVNGLVEGQKYNLRANIKVSGSGITNGSAEIKFGNVSEGITKLSGKVDTTKYVDVVFVYNSSFNNILEMHTKTKELEESMYVTFTDISITDVVTATPGKVTIEKTPEGDGVVTPETPDGEKYQPGILTTEPTVEKSSKVNKDNTGFTGDYDASKVEEVNNKDENKVLPKTGDNNKGNNLMTSLGVILATLGAYLSKRRFRKYK